MFIVLGLMRLNLNKNRKTEIKVLDFRQKTQKVRTKAIKRKTKERILIQKKKRSTKLYPCSKQRTKRRKKLRRKSSIG